MGVHVAYEQTRGFKHQNILVAWWAKGQISSALKLHQDSALVDKLKQQPGIIRNFVAIFNSVDYDLRECLRDFFVRLFEHEKDTAFLRNLIGDLHYYGISGTPFERLGVIGIFGSALHSPSAIVKTIGYEGLEAVLIGGSLDEKKLALNQIETKVVIDNSGVPPSLELTLRSARGDLDSDVSNAAIRILSHIKTEN